MIDIDEQERAAVSLQDKKRQAAAHMIRPSFAHRRRGCKFCEEKELVIDYKDVALLKKYTSDMGKIIGRRKTGLCAKHQRAIARAVKRARFMALMPYRVQVEI
jgi:small subunit ribosomal protein S18